MAASAPPAATGALRLLEIAENVPRYLTALLTFNEAWGKIRNLGRRFDVLEDFNFECKEVAIPALKEGVTAALTTSMAEFRDDILVGIDVATIGASGSFRRANLDKAAKTERCVFILVQGLGGDKYNVNVAAYVIKNETNSTLLIGIESKLDLDKASQSYLEWFASFFGRSATSKKITTG